MYSSVLASIRFRLVVAVVLCCGVAVSARVLGSRDQALARRYGDVRVERSTVFLNEAQLVQVEDAAGTRPGSSVIYRYEVFRQGVRVATAYLDAHRVRTLPETLLIAIDEDGAVDHLEVLSFKEPMEYLPGEKWYTQFSRRKLDRDLRLKRGIDGITGATLTCRATCDSVRRALATHRVLAAAAGSPGTASPARP